MIILIFGLVLNNTDLFLRGKLSKIFKLSKLQLELRQLKNLTAESAFLVRTFFFVLFGFTINLNSLLNPQILIIGGIIVAILLGVRFLYLKFFAKISLMPELLIAPRVLITILLFYSIPENFIISEFSEGILLVVIILTSILMMIGLLLTKNHEEGMEDISEAALQL
jgi:hypothetical protein